jgi:WD40 repeat protein
MGNKIAILTFNQKNSQFGIAKEWSFPKPELNYSYYSQKENFIYLSAENPKTTLFDIFVYDMMTGVLITIEEAHQGNVTDVIHFSNEILLSGSKDGSIRVWKIAG